MFFTRFFGLIDGESTYFCYCVLFFVCVLHQFPSKYFLICPSVRIFLNLYFFEDRHLLINELSIICIKYRYQISMYVINNGYHLSIYSCLAFQDPLAFCS